MPTPSSKERAREIVGRCLCVKTLEPVGPVYGANIKCLPCQMAGRITAAIDAAVEEEREACAVICEDFVQVVGGTLTARQHWYKIAAKRVAAKIRARGGDRE